MIRTGCDAAKIKIPGRDTFNNNSFGSKKTILMTFVNHGQRLKDQKRKSGTNANYIPRIKKKSEKRHRGEDVTTPV